MHTKIRLLLLTVVLLALPLAACRRGANVEPTAIRPPTSTPRSTPLPPVATAIPPGAEENPIVMTIVRPATARSQSVINDAADELQALLNEETGLTFEVNLVDTPADAVGELCASGGGTVTVAWLNGLAYAAANAQGCGVPALQVERDGSEAERVQLIASETLGASGISGLSGSSFCRVGYDDFYTWLVPSMMLRANNIDPINGLDEIVDVQDSASVITSIAEGDCDAGGVTVTDFEDLGEEVEDEVITVGQPAAIPYAILTYPPELPLGARWSLTDALMAIADDPERADVLEPLLQQDALIPVEEDDFNQLLSFIRSAGLDLAEFGG